MKDDTISILKNIEILEELQDSVFSDINHNMVSVRLLERTVLAPKNNDFDAVDRRTVGTLVDRNAATAAAADDVVVVVANKRTEFLNYTETQGVPQSIIKLKI